MRYTILTGLRTAEVLGTRAGEIDWTAKTHTVPAARMKRMKMKQPHVVPLSDEARVVLKQAEALRASDYMFGGARAPVGRSATRPC